MKPNQLTPEAKKRIEENAPRLLEIARAVCRGATHFGDPAADAASDALVRCAAKHPRLNPAQFRAAWLKATKRNVATYRRREARRRVLAPTNQLATDVPTQDDGTNTTVIRDLITSLPAQLREVARLAWLDGLDAVAIATRLDIGAAWVRKLLAECRAFARRILSPNWSLTGCVS